MSAEPIRQDGDAQAKRSTPQSWTWVIRRGWMFTWVVCLLLALLVFRGDTRVSQVGHCWGLAIVSLAAGAGAEIHVRRLARAERSPLDRTDEP